jgi:hypothetical protein
MGGPFGPIVLVTHRNGSQRPAVPNYFCGVRANVTERLRRRCGALPSAAKSSRPRGYPVKSSSNGEGTGSVASPATVMRRWRGEKPQRKRCASSARIPASRRWYSRRYWRARRASAKQVMASCSSVKEMALETLPLVWATLRGSLVKMDLRQETDEVLRASA